MRNTEADSPKIQPASIEEAYIHVVAAIIWNPLDDARLLISKRQTGKHLAGYWELPGGKLEPGESPWQALRRELREEISIEITAAEPYLKVYHRYPERNILLDTWCVNAYRGEPVATEQQRIIWVRIDQLDGYRFPAADGPILEAIKSNVKA